MKCLLYWLIAMCFINMCLAFLVLGETWVMQDKLDDIITTLDRIEAKIA